MAWIAAGIAGGTALLKLGTGAIQNGQASSIEKNNPFPTYTVQPEYEKNVRQSEQMAQVGTPQEQYNNQYNSINRNVAGGVAALSNSANPGANLASIVRQGNDSNNTLNAQDAIARNRNMLNLLRERQALAQQKDKAWDWNSQQKYLGNLAKSQALRGAGNSNLNGAFNDLSSEATTLGNNGAFSGSSNGGNPANTIGDWGQQILPTGAFSYGQPSDRSGMDVSWWGGKV